MTGELDLATAGSLQNVLEQLALEEGWARNLMLDLAGLSFIDVAGFASIERHDARLARAGGRLTVPVASRQVRRFLALIDRCDLLSEKGESG